jgi:hypothetical protein
VRVAGTDVRVAGTAVRVAGIAVWYTPTPRQFVPPGEKDGCKLKNFST